jgi:hypothetical protein
MVRKLVFLVLVLAITGTAYAQTDVWTGATSSNWMDKTNWSLGIVPTTDVDADFVMLVANTEIDGGTLHYPVISAGQVASTATYDTWGPQWGATLDIVGGSYSGPALFGLNAEQWDSGAARSIINLGAGGLGGSINIVNLLIGDSPWWHDGKYATYNQYSGTATASDYIWVGGKMNLFGGETTVLNGMNVAVSGELAADCTVDILAPSVDGNGGKLSLPLAWYNPSVPVETTVAAWVAGGFLVSTNGTLVYDYVSEPGRLVISAIPEPSTITLLCIGGLLGGLALIRRKRS